MNEETRNNISIVHVDNIMQLSEAVDVLKESNLVALDTEFDNNRTRFGMNLELIQVFDGSKVYLIRACRIPDLAALNPLLADSNIIKVIYSASEDIQALKSRGLSLHGLYDLQVAAKLAGLESRSFVQLVKELTGVELSKAQQQSNWRAKQLSDAQVAYAANDVIYTLRLYLQVKDKIQPDEKVQLLNEKNKAIESVNLQTIKPKLKPNHLRQSKAVQQKIKKLLELRDRIAEKKDVAPYRVFPGEFIDEIWMAGKAFESISLLKGCPRPYQSNFAETKWIDRQIKNILRGE